MKMESILTHFGIENTRDITQIHEHAWDIDNTYVLKSNKSRKELDKSIKVNGLLLSEGVPVIAYLRTTKNKAYVRSVGNFWCLMKKINGTVFDPFIGETTQNGILLGKAVAQIHVALKSIEDRMDVNEKTVLEELLSWILPVLKKHDFSFHEDVIESIHRIDFDALPRQLIHRDIHTSNLLFENNKLTGYIDFDMIQRNIRIFDIAYLSCSQLVDNYKNPVRLQQWYEIFSGILQGYEEVSSLSQAEIESIPALFVFIEVLFTAFYLQDGATETAKNCAAMANWLHENHTMFAALRP